MTTRADIVAAATAWIGTPYHSGADLLGVGVDCAMLPVRVFCGLGLVPLFDPRPYPHDWMLHRSEERYLGWVERWAERVENAQPGDLVLFRFGRCVSHGGIVCERGYMIHAHLPAGRVTRAEIAPYASRLHSYWSVRGV